MKTSLNKILNLAFSAKRRYKKVIEISDTSVLLSNFSVSTNNPVRNKKYVKVGSKSLINSKFIFETSKGEVLIGNNVYIGQSTFICRTKIIVDDYVTIAWGVTFYDHDSHSLNFKLRQEDNDQMYDDYINFKGNFLINKNWNCVNTKQIHINKNVWIGMDAIILKGVTIGEGAIIAAKSVVTKNVDPFTLVGGNPAKFIKYLH